MARREVPVKYQVKPSKTSLWAFPTLTDRARLKKKNKQTKKKQKEKKAENKERARN